MLPRIFTVGDVATVLDSNIGFPFIDLFHNATKSYAATDVMCAVVIINLTASAIAVLATASRQLWSFGRNKGVPFSSWLAPAVLPREMPLNALYVTLGIAILLSLIDIGSSAALQAIFTISSASLLTSYMVTIGCIIHWRLRGEPLPPARFSLGRWGLSMNIASMCFLLPWFVFSFFPNVVDPTPVSMNWGCVMYGFIITFSTVYYVVWSRYTYTPPSDHVKQVVVEDQFYVGSDGSERETEHQQVNVVGKDELDSKDL
jgi:amino acid transporter